MNHTSNSIPSLITINIREILKPDVYNEKYLAEIDFVNGKPTHGNIIFYIPQDSLRNVQVDDRISMISVLENIAGPLNPYQFNYKNYLANKGVYKEIDFRKSKFLNFEKQPKSSLKGLAARARSTIITELKKNGFQDDELAIIEALLLGEKKDVSKEVYNQYADAGVIHILAVSGLHVGIILLLLNYLLSPLKYFAHGALIQLILVVGLLWCFAFLAGLSASILRAVTMFTFVAIGMHFNRKGHVLNAVATSLIIILLINPFYLFEVGFQLSYVAVISIVIFQPVFNRFFKVEKKLPKMLWGIFTVSWAAQIGVLPLTLFYFHQFPGLFFVSNLIILPFLGIILGVGILVIALALFGMLPSFIAEAYELIIFYLNSIVRWISEQQVFVLKDIPFSDFQAIAFYVLICSTFLFLKKMSAKRFQYILGSIILIQLVFVYQKRENSESEVVVFHQSRNSALGIKENHSLKTYSDSDIENASFLKTYLLEEEIAQENVEYSGTLDGFHFYKDQKILIIDSLGIYNIDVPTIDFLILKNSPEINLERLIEVVDPTFIIADGSNYPSFVNQWKETCKKGKIPFHSTREKGAFIVE